MLINRQFQYAIVGGVSSAFVGPFLFRALLNDTLLPLLPALALAPS